MLDIDALNQLIARRRTIKPLKPDGSPNYKPDAIPRHILQTLLDNANWAPTHGKTEPWRFSIFAGEARNELATFLFDAYRRLTPEAEFKSAKQDKLKLYVEHSPCTISLGMRRHEGKIPAEEEVIAVACAVQNLHLTATAFGLGGFWSSSPIYDHDETKRFLNLGPSDRCLGLFFLGYPADPWPTRQPGAIAEKIHWR